MPWATEWNVPAVTRPATPSRGSRRRSSPAASRVNVSTSVCDSSAVPVATRYATRRVSTRVLPDPAPATTATSCDSVVDGAALVVVEAGEQRTSVHAVHGTVRPMPYPKKLLNDYETVALDLHPHWWYFAKPAAALVVSILVGIASMVWLDGDAREGRQLGRRSPASWSSAIWLVTRYIQWSTTNFVITSDRVIFRTGVFAKHGIEIPLERVNNVIFHQSMIERMLGAGDLLIESGGEDGQQRFTDVRDPTRCRA